MTRRLSPSRVAIAGIMLLLPAVLGGAGADLRQRGPLSQSRDAAAADDLFAAEVPLQIALQIADDGIAILRRARPAQDSDSRPETVATVVEAGREYTAVSVHLKGFTTFQPIDQRPSLTLNFDKHTPKQTFHGLEKISLNNAALDATRLNEMISRDVFAAAGVPVARAQHAYVTLNGRPLGLYVLTEGFDKRFLERQFERTDGNLYEGGDLTDITSDLELVTGKNPPDDPAVARLIQAAREPDPDKRFQAIAAAVDLDRFLTMVAIETILCHSDSYSLNKNNYRLYHDPATDKIVFIPHGMDRVLGTHRSALDLSIVPPRLGLVARALLSTAEGRRRYVERVRVLVKQVFRPAPLCIRARELTRRTNAPQDAEDVCSRITMRAAQLEFQLSNAADLIKLVPAPEFDVKGVAEIPAWSVAPRLGQPPVASATERRDGRSLLRLHADMSPLVTSLRTRFVLPTGTYRLSGRITVGDTGLADRTSIAVSLVRVTAGRFAYERRPLGSGDIDLIFQVPDSVSPEELELTCDLRGVTSDLWFESALKVVKLAG